MVAVLWFENLPAAQEEQIDAPALENRPTVHANENGLLDPEGQKKPAKHVALILLLRYLKRTYL